ncbi:tld domain-containing protein [Cyclospora cayetanensis]|uniref:Tld domain-containing protein n=1 Tax=Cyclospora cayetanensis TaxID=88456 RepID=A0A1D3CU69_9EIME|nr:tld domain-containing protein [Cyclospora cayetanensis]
MQPYVSVDTFSKWRQLDQEEQQVWAPRGERILREHLLPFVPPEVSPAIAAMEADTAEGGGSGGLSRSSACRSSAVPASAATPMSANRLAAFFGSSSAPASNNGGSSAHSHQQPWSGTRVKEQLRDEIWSGIPDAFKCCVLLHANDALQQLEQQPTLYRQVQVESFGGPPFPGSLPGRCPTFSGGLLGLEEDVCGVQTTLEHLELDGDAPLATWRSASSETEQEIRRSERSSWTLRMRRPHQYLPGMSPSNRRVAALPHASRSPGKNPLGQELRPEFNFWPDTHEKKDALQAAAARSDAAAAGLSPPLRLPRQAHQTDRQEASRQLKLQKQKRRGRRRDILLCKAHQLQQRQQPAQRMPSQHQRRAGSEGGGGSTESKGDSPAREANVGELLTYIGPTSTKASQSRTQSGAELAPADPTGSTSAKWQQLPQEPFPSGKTCRSSSDTYGVSPRTNGSSLAGAAGIVQQSFPAVRERSPAAGVSGGEGELLPLPPPSPVTLWAPLESACSSGGSPLVYADATTMAGGGGAAAAACKEDVISWDLFGRRRSGELEDFSSYMKHMHLDAQRQAAQMRESTQRSRDRIAFEAAAAAVMAVAREVDNERDRWAFRRYYTATSFDLVEKGLWGQRKPGRRGGSESQLIRWDPLKGRLSNTQSVSRQSAPTRSFVSFLNNSVRRRRRHRQQAPLAFSQPQLLYDRKGDTPIITQQRSPLEGIPGSPCCCSSSGKADEVSAESELSPMSVSAPPLASASAEASPYASRGGLWSRLSGARSRRRTHEVASEGRERLSVVSWLQRAAAQSSEGSAALGGKKGRDEEEDPQMCIQLPLDHLPNPPIEPFRKKGLLTRILPSVRLCRSRKGKEAQELKRLDFLSNAMRGGGDPFDTDKLVAAAANAAVRDIRRRSSSSTHSDDLIQSARGAATVAAAAAAADFPPLRSSSLLRSFRMGDEEDARIAESLPTLPEQPYKPQSPQQGEAKQLPEEHSRQPFLQIEPLPEPVRMCLMRTPPKQEDTETPRGHDGEARLSLKNAVYFLEDVTDFSRLLNGSGQAAARRLLWALFGFFRGGLEFCPIIPHLACILLLYMSETAAFTVLYCFVKKAQDTAKQLPHQRILHRLDHIVIRRMDFIWLVTSVVEAIRFKFPRLFLHMRHLRVDIPAWAARGLQDGFSRLLPFDFVLRIMSTLLFEGSLALCKFSLALVQLLEPELMACDTTEAAECVLYRCSSDPRLNLNELSWTAQHLKTSILRAVGEGTLGLQSPYLMCTKIHEFLTIRPEGNSRILTSMDMWESLWRWLPDIHRCSSPSLLFTSSHDGFTLSALMANVRTSKVSMVFLALTDGAEIIGFFSPHPLHLLDTATSMSQQGGNFTEVERKGTTRARRDSNATETASPRQAAFVVNADLTLRLFLLLYEAHTLLLVFVCIGFIYSDAFVFNLRPTPRVFWWTGKNSSFFRLRPEGFYLGTDEVALWVDQDLSRCRSSPSVTFGSPSLIRGDFGECHLVDVEVWGVK